MKIKLIRKWIWRIIKLTVGVVLVYMSIVLLGLFPANRDFESTAEGIPVSVSAGAIHCDLIMPIESQVVDWREHFPREDFTGPIGDFTHISIGWGDRGFYLDTPRWRDLKFSTFVHAVFVASPSVVHVQYQHEPLVLNRQRQVRLSVEQYRRLVSRILASVKKHPSGANSGPTANFKHIDFRYSDFDTFYEGVGSYHAFNTCNCWAADTLQAAGVCVPQFSPCPSSVLMYFPKPEDENSGD